jgi:16S rRNA processing protein RimM
VDEPTVVVGLITKAHGLRGEVTVQSRSDNPDRWVPGAVVHVAGGPLTVVTVRARSGDRLLVKFAEINDRVEAEKARGEVVIPESWLPELGDGEWWPHQIEGCRVVTGSGRELGRVAEVIPNPANDLWVVVDDDGNETLVPALRDLLTDIDIDAKLIRVREVPGLTAPG